MSESNSHDFEQFMKRREEAARAFVAGDGAPLARMATRAAPATFFHPRGHCHEGPEEVRSIYEHNAARFVSGDCKLETLQMAAGDDVAYWVGIQRGTAVLEGSAGPAPLNLRVTEVFRREDGEWKLAHRHADFLPAESS